MRMGVLKLMCHSDIVPILLFCIIGLMRPSVILGYPFRSFVPIGLNKEIISLIRTFRNHEILLGEIRVGVGLI